MRLVPFRVRVLVWVVLGCTNFLSLLVDIFFLIQSPPHGTGARASWKKKEQVTAATPTPRDSVMTKPRKVLSVKDLRDGLASNHTSVLRFFESLDANNDGRVVLREAAQGLLTLCNCLVFFQLNTAQRLSAIAIMFCAQSLKRPIHSLLTG